MKPEVCILDYGSGNVRSVYNLFAAMGVDAVVTNEVQRIESATHLVLPGVGAFGASMERIRAHIPLETVRREVFERKKPFLGICVGMQVLAERGEEFGDHEGLGWIQGVVGKMNTRGAPLPHIGWNDIKIVRPSPLLEGVPSSLDFYFVHSFVFRPIPGDIVNATTEYGDEFACVVSRDNIFGVQFHPEKSQKAGRRLMQNFLALS